MDARINRRGLFRSLAASVGAAQAAQTVPALDVLRNVSAAHGSNFGDERLLVLQPVLDSRRAQLKALREFEIDDSVAPTNGCF